ncbi:DNA mismatch repair protein MutS [bacterium]|nr:DNA mismatch repair protein MutS [bacterium]
MLDKTKLTPVMQQYVDMKAENPDALLMFRLGDFYEAFFDDARQISEILNLVLTTRGNSVGGAEIPMCGVPWHMGDTYLGRLVHAGYKVALVEQMETPAQAKERGHKFIERRVVRVLTPGTITDENLLTPKHSNFLVAVVPNGDAFDIAGCDISTGEFFIGDTTNPMDDMVRVNPAEIIYPSEYAETAAIKALRDMFKTAPVFEKLYRRTDIDMIVGRVFGGAVPSGTPTGSDGAIALLAGYLFNTQRDANITFRTARYFNSSNQLLIDSATWKSLEIDAPINDGGACLLDVIDETRTAAGGRRLREYLRTLTCDKTEIHARQEHIGHLLLNSDVAGALGVALGAIPDVGRSLSRLLTNRGTPRDLRHVSDFLSALPNIRLAGMRMDESMALRFADIDTHDVLTDRLRNALADSLPTFFRDGGVIRDGFDAALDNMRTLAHGAKETIAALQAEYSAQTGINTLKIKYNNILGYFIEVPNSRADILMRPDSGFIHRQTMASSMRFTTPRLIDLDNEVRSAGDRAAGIEAEIVADFIEKIRAIYENIQDSVEVIADADVWYALAMVAARYSWTRPTITDGREFDVTGARHPVIEAALRRRGDNFVKNDCHLTTHSVALLTGPNMAGKSTYLRQNAMLVVLAHLGSFVPAQTARIGICDQLFSRVGASDNLAAGQSTFMVEMSETANILKRATNRSFIIFDEIGRGTATYDGMAIAQAVLEYLNELSPRALFATHYHELTKLTGDSDGNLRAVTCLTIDVREHNDEIVFLHKIIPGVANRSYGIHVARMAGMPASVVARADAVLAALEASHGLPPAQPGPVITTPTPAKKTPRVSEPKSDAPQLNLFG